MDEVPSGFDKFKAHFKKYQSTYIVGGVSLAIITCLIMRESRAVLDASVDCPTKEPTDSFSFNSGKSLFGSVNNSIVTTIHKGTKGSSGFITRCVETNDIFETQGDAARFFDIPESIMSKHLNQGRELVENLHFERVGVLTTV